MSTQIHSLTHQERALLATIAYTDQFSYPLTELELSERLLRVPISLSKSWSVRKCLKTLVSRGYIETVLQNDHQFFFLPGRAEIVSARFQSTTRAQPKLNEAQGVAQILANIPWVEAVYLTGSLAMESAKGDSDIDFLIITQPQRLWLVRLFTGLFAQWRGKRRSWNHEEPGSWCFNLWLDTAHLEVETEKQDTYRAYEVLQAKLLWSREKGRDILMANNRWISQFFPLLNINRSVENRQIHNRSNRLPFFSLLLDKGEALVWRVQSWYMQKHQTTERVGRGYAFFHPRDTATDIYQGWQTSLSRILPKLVVMEILHPYVDSHSLS